MRAFLEGLLKRRILVWLGALVPLALLGLLYQQHQLPRWVADDSQDLDGTWKMVLGNPAGAEGPAFDDRSGLDIHIPGNFAPAGAAREGWLRHHVQGVPSLLEGAGFLIIGDTRGAGAEVWINGESIGVTERNARGYKTELTGRDAWVLRKGILHSGDNVIAIHFKWANSYADGIHDAVLLGPDSSLGGYFRDLIELRRKLQYGAGMLMIFLIILFSALSLAEWSTPNRALYLSCIALLLAAIAYLSVMCGFLFHPRTSGSWLPPTIFLCILGVAWTQVDFVTRYFEGPRSWFRRANSVVCFGFMTIFLTRIVSPTLIPWTGDVMAMSLYILIQLTYVFFLAARQLQRRTHELDPVLFSGVVITMVTGGTDTLQDLGIVSLMRMYPIGISATAIMAAVVLIVDFTKISYDNKNLSLSLKETNADLANALIKAQEASRLKSEFVANISHELRTPLNSVINIPEGLLEGVHTYAAVHCAACDRIFELEPGEKLNAELQCPACGQARALRPGESKRFDGEAAQLEKGLKQIHRAGSHLLRLIDDVLDFSKIESGQMTLNVKRIPLRAALEDSVSTVKSMADLRKIHLEIDATDGVLCADPIKLSQILINLLGNAIKFSHDGGVVTLSVKPSSDAKGWELSVKDQGIGIASEHHQTIFESFRQVDGSNTRRFGGTGLGLAIVRRLVEAHRGKVWLESAPGRGSQFFVSLPQLEADSQISVQVPPPAASADSTVPRKLLIVDDDPSAADTLRAALAPLPHEVHGIGSADALAQTIETLHPDLLVLDVMLPGANGLDVLRTLQAQATPIPVLVSSGYNHHGELVKSLGASWMAKPWKADELRAEVTRLLVASRLSLKAEAPVYAAGERQ